MPIRVLFEPIFKRCNPCLVIRHRGRRFRLAEMVGTVDCPPPWGQALAMHPASVTVALPSDTTEPRKSNVWSRAMTRGVSSVQLPRGSKLAHSAFCSAAGVAGRTAATWPPPVTSLAKPSAWLAARAGVTSTAAANTRAERHWGIGNVNGIFLKVEYRRPSLAKQACHDLNRRGYLSNALSPITIAFS